MNKARQDRNNGRRIRAGENRENKQTRKESEQSAGGTAKTVESAPSIDSPTSLPRSKRLKSLGAVSAESTKKTLDSMHGTKEAESFIIKLLFRKPNQSIAVKISGSGSAIILPCLEVCTREQARLYQQTCGLSPNHEMPPTRLISPRYRPHRHH